jgi:exonuclease VII large subunit
LQRLVLVTRRKIILFLVLWGGLAAIAIPALASESAGKYSKLSNNELKSRALTIVKAVRKIVYSYKEKDRDLTSDFDANYLATRTTERESLRDQWRKKIDDAQAASVRDYRQNFASDAALLREELQRRLPKSLQRRDIAKLHSNPANVLSLEVIADDLELLAKSLPEN